MSGGSVSHDQLFKDLLRAFFREFMELFYPSIAARLDFSRVTFLDKEVFTDLPEGKQQEADLVVKVYTRDGKPELVLIHIEVESWRRGKFPARMFDYFTLLRLRHREQIYPIVIYLVPGAGGLQKETYREDVFGEEVVHFQYSAVGLPDLLADDYLSLDNPLVSGLSALMRVSRLGKAVQKVWSLRKAAQSPVDEARRFLLVNLIETYLKLNKTEAAEFEGLVAQPDAEEVREMISVYEERGIAKGKRETLLRQLQHKFGKLPKRVIAKIEAIQNEAQLDALLERILDANSLEEMGLSNAHVN